MFLALLALALLAVGAFDANSASATSTWSNAVRIVLDNPRPAPFSFNAESDSASHLSCTADGACTLGGSYYWQNYGSHALLATSTGGVWSNGTPPPGFDFDPDTQYWLWNFGSAIQALSCSSPGKCAIVGIGATTVSGADVVRPFMSNSTRGVWGAPRFLPEGGIFTSDYNISFTSLSCSAAGECVAAGRSGHGCGEYCWVNEAFLLVQIGGVWQSAVRVPGLAELNTGSDSQVTSVSCSSPGNCMVGGFYSVMNGSAVEVRPFVASSTNHVWSDAVTIPGVTPDNPDDVGPSYPRMKVSVSCPTDGSCVVGGAYTGNNTFVYGAYADKTSFVATRSGGTWTTIFVSDLLAPGTTPRIDSTVSAVSCATATSCTAVGRYTVGGGRQGFIATLSGSTWTAVPVPGLSALNTSNDATVSSVSCAPIGTCALGGSYLSGSQRHAFVTARTNGAWSDAVPVPRLVAMNIGGWSDVTAVSCSNTGDCSAIGIYRFDPQNPGKQRVFATRLTAGGDPNSSTTSSTMGPSTTTTTIDGSVTPDGATDGSGSSDANRSSDGAADGATDPIAPAFAG